MQNVIELEEQIPLSGKNITDMLKSRGRVVLYDALKVNDIKSLMYKVGSVWHVIILYNVSRTQYESLGHWIAFIIDDEKKVMYHYDSLAYEPDQELAILHHPERYYSQHLEKLSKYYRLEVNQEKMQDLVEHTATCGRWAAMRCVFYYLDNEQFNSMIKGLLDSVDSPDHIITLLTFMATN